MQISQWLRGLFEPSVRLDPSKVTRTSIHVAAYKGFAKGVKLLIEHGVDVNAKDDGGQTALHCASFKDHPDIAEMLIEAGANLNARDANGMTPLSIALHAGSTVTEKVLEEHGAKTEKWLDLAYSNKAHAGDGK
jgi:ankyrin repeat protein